LNNKKKIGGGRAGGKGNPNKRKVSKTWKHTVRKDKEKTKDSGSPETGEEKVSGPQLQNNEWFQKTKKQLNRGVRRKYGRSIRDQRIQRTGTSENRRKGGETLKSRTHAPGGRKS